MSRTRRWLSLSLLATPFAIPALVYAGLPLNPVSKGPAYVSNANFVPGHPVKVTLGGGASVSTTLTGTQIGNKFRLSCTVAAAYMSGIGGQTATADDNQISGTQPEWLMLKDGQTTLAIFSATAGACYLGFQP